MHTLSLSRAPHAYLPSSLSERRILGQFAGTLQA